MVAVCGLVGAERVAGVLGHIDGAEDVKVEQTTGMPIITVRPNRPVVARLGLDSDTVVNTVNIATGGREAGQVFQGDRRFDIVVRLPEALRQRSDALANLLIPLPHRAETEHGSSLNGDPHATHIAPVRPLSDLAQIDRAEGANQVSRENSKRRVVVQCNVRGRDLAGFVKEANHLLFSQNHGHRYMSWNGLCGNSRKGPSWKAACMLKGVCG